MQRKLEISLARKNAQLRRALNLATNNGSQNWQYWIHEQDCMGGPDVENECTCDGNYIIKEVIKALRKSK
jgi:hypothetical protein